MSAVGWLFKFAELGIHVVEIVVTRNKAATLKTGPTALELARRRMRARARMRLGR